MAISRYAQAPRMNFGAQYGTSDTISKIRAGVQSGQIPTTVIFLKEIIRLDVLAGQYYGDAKYYWIIASASSVGWSLQIPPNTRIVIPDLQQALRYLG
jgi:hypothetical protein